MKGLSVIICCHNGASRLPTTLAHLKAQEPPEIPWEVLLIDNAATDSTVAVARSCWKDGPAPLRIVSESRLGTRFARERGFYEAAYSFVGFVDDDNWVAGDWVRVAYQVMSSDCGLGAVGSIRIPAFESPLPAWFDYYHGPYAILTEPELQCMQQPPLQLPTAGLCVRAEAWQDLVESGFQSQLPGRVGGDLSGGEDTELTIALRFRGWKLEVTPRLRLQHFLPKHRIQWTYLRRLMRNCDPVLLDCYSGYSLSLKEGLRCRTSDWWCYQFARMLTQLARKPGAVLAALVSNSENRHDVIEVERMFGRAVGLLRCRGQYGLARRLVRQAPWRCSRYSDTAIRLVVEGGACEV